MAAGFDRKVTFSREQVNEMTPYDPCTVKIPDGGSLSIGDLVDKLRDTYDLTEDMVYMKNGQPVGTLKECKNLVLEDGDHVFGKQGMKARGEN